eukprot:4576132-Amphidinium_carterae.1
MQYHLRVSEKRNTRKTRKGLPPPTNEGRKDEQANCSRGTLGTRWAKVLRSETQHYDDIGVKRKGSVVNMFSVWNLLASKTLVRRHPFSKDRARLCREETSRS